MDSEYRGWPFIKLIHPQFYDVIVLKPAKLHESNVRCGPGKSSKGT